MSLRRSLVIAFAILLTLVGTLAAIYAYTSARREAWDIMDLQQQQFARFVGDGAALGGADGSLPVHDKDEDYVIRFRYADSRPERQSNPQPSFPPNVPNGFSDFDDGSGVWRVFSQTVNGTRVDVAQRTSERDELAADAALSSAMPFVIAIPLSWIIVYGLVGAILSRLSHVVSSVERRSLSDLSPISHAHVPSELIPLIDAVNSAFARIDKSARQQQQFVSDAAHELRTPLTALALQVGNLASSSQGGLDEDRIAELQKGVRRASKVTAQLLQLARHDMKPEKQAPENLDLADTVHQVVAGLVPLAADRGVDLGILDVSSAKLLVSQQVLSVLMECLIDNAVRYTPAGGSVDVSLQVAGKTAKLIVSDTGPGLAEDQLEKVFERFYRAARTDETGTGLGLAIVKSIATENSWKVRLSNRADRSGLEAVVEFPLV